jgi:4-oxalocrotonate tautomerase
MPLVRISVVRGKPATPLRKLGDAVHREAGVRREDVWVNLVEVPRENWSFGNGIASYAP